MKAWRHQGAGVLVWMCAIAVVLPLLTALIASVAEGWAWPALLPSQLTFRWWASDALHGPVASALFTTVTVALCVTFVCALISIPAARALALSDFPGKHTVEAMLLLPVIVPPIAVVTGMQHVMIVLGLADTFFGVVLAHVVPAAPYMLRVLKTAYAAGGGRLEEQARNLGASATQTFLRVTLPVLAPGLVVGGTLAFLVSTGQYLLTFMCGGGRVLTLPLLLYPHAAAGNRPIAAVLSILLSVPGMLFILAAEAYLHRKLRDREVYFV